MPIEPISVAKPIIIDYPLSKTFLLPEEQTCRYNVSIQINLDNISILTEGGNEQKINLADPQKIEEILDRGESVHLELPLHSGIKIIIDYIPVPFEKEGGSEATLRKIRKVVKLEIPSFDKNVLKEIKKNLGSLSKREFEYLILQCAQILSKDEEEKRVNLSLKKD